jgi:hypothetical protein
MRAGALFPLWAMLTYRSFADASAEEMTMLGAIPIVGDLAAAIDAPSAPWPSFPSLIGVLDSSKN